jgi:hypothetical protein
MAGWNVIATFVLDQLFGYQTANMMRENMIALASARLKYHLGGSRQLTLLRSAAVQDAVEWIDQEIDGTALAGFTKQARVEVRTMAAGTSITPRIQNVTDGTTAGTGVACTATNADYSGTNQKQTIALTLAAGVKKYRLQATLSNVNADAFVTGHIEVFATA